MKKTFFTAILALFTWAANAQIIQINPYAGWSTSSALQLYYGKARTTDGINFGGNLSFGQGMSSGGFTRNAFIELQYNYLQADLEYDSYSGIGDEAFGKISIHNAMIGGTKGQGNGKVEGYGGTYLGVTIYDPSDKQFDTRTRFTLSFGAGLKYALSPKVGLRLHAQMYMPIWGSGFYLGWSPGGGTSTGVMATAVNVYANFNLGVYLNIDKNQ